MERRLKRYILEKIYAKEEVTNYERYEGVVGALATYANEDDVCSYIIRCLHSRLASNSTTLTDGNILSVLTHDFCVSCASDYISFLYNQHEYAHIHEQEFFGR